MNNKPVAWGFFDKDGVIYDCVTTQDYLGESGRPLYTHPHSDKSVKAKTLTDEEIWEVINRTAWVGTEEEIRFKIAEAILRKAQEK